jgi:hypothetical protein
MQTLIVVNLSPASAPQYASELCASLGFQFPEYSPIEGLESSRAAGRDEQ